MDAAADTADDEINLTGVPITVIIVDVARLCALASLIVILTKKKHNNE